MIRRACGCQFAGHRIINKISLSATPSPSCPILFRSLLETLSPPPTHIALLFVLTRVHAYIYTFICTYNIHSAVPSVELISASTAHCYSGQNTTNFTAAIRVTQAQELVFTRPPNPCWCPCMHAILYMYNVLVSSSTLGRVEGRAEAVPTIDGLGVGGCGYRGKSYGLMNKSIYSFESISVNHADDVHCWKT